jgi:TolB protein
MSRTIASFALLALAVVACSDSTPTAPSLNTAQTNASPPSPAPGATEYIYVAATDGSGAARLTLGSSAAWSPDGRRLAFHRGPTWAEPLVMGVIYLIDADGQNETKLLAGKWPSWSPDGKAIAFVDDDGIEVMDADGSNKRLILRRYFLTTTSPSSDMGPAKPMWSPEGKRIAFEHQGDGDMEPAQIFVIDVDGSNLHRVSVNAGGFLFAESDPAWSPDGSQLAYWSYGYGLAITDARGGTPRSVFMAFPKVSYGAKPAWSRDGTSLAFNVWNSERTSRSALALDLRKGPLTMLARDGFDVAYSPDEKRIAYTSTR